MGSHASKIAFPILWESKNLLYFYTISCSFMALSGSFAIFLPRIMARPFFINPGILGIFLLSTGLILRAFFFNMAVAVISGIFCGIGSSLMILVFKNFVVNIKEPDRSCLVCKNITLSKVGQIIGSIISGYFISAFSRFFHFGIEIALVFSAIPVFLIIFFLPQKTMVDVIENTKYYSVLKYISYNVKFTLSIVFTVFLSGFYQASLIPLIPIYLKTGGLSTQNIGLLMSSGIILGIIVNYIISKKKYFNNSGKIYFIISIFSSTFLIGYITPMPLYITSFSALFYIFSRTVASTFSNVIEMNLVDEKYASSLFGILSTTFLISDILGSSISYFVFELRSFWLTSFLIALLSITNGFLLMYISNKKFGHKITSF